MSDNGVGVVYRDARDGEEAKTKAKEGKWVEETAQRDKSLRGHSDGTDNEDE